MSDASGSNEVMSKVSQENSLDIDLVRAALDADYEILEELGRGGMAVVYRARERALDREVAIKVLPSFMSMDAAFVDRFQHEARTAGQLEHPGIVPIYRVGSKGKVIYFVMKLLRGQSLATVLKQRWRLGVPEIRRILIETSSALGYAAKHDVVHRDIKPDNILLDDEGRCVLTDFGIAKSSGGPLTAAGTSMGTPRYMSPEHARGITLDGRSDMYSLGVVAYQCLSGRTPFDADDPFAVLYKHINEPIPTPALETEEEREIYPVIEKMLAKQPEDRYQTAEELIAALGGTATSGAQTLMSVLLPNPTLTRPPRPSLMSATEIIESPTLRRKLRELYQNPRTWAAVGAVGLITAVAITLASNDNGASGATPTAAGVVGATTNVAGATTKAAGGTTSVAAGTTTGARPDSTSRPGAGASTGTRVASNATKTSGTTNSKTGTKTDTGRPALSGLSRVGSNTASVRTPAPAPRDASKCPRTAAPDVFSLLVDSVPPQKVGARLTVGFDVCGLAANSPFSATITFRKLNQGRFSRQQDRTLHVPSVATGPRSRFRQVVELAGLSAGEYRMDVLIRDARLRDLGAGHRFRISER